MFPLMLLMVEVLSTLSTYLNEPLLPTAVLQLSGGLIVELGTLLLTCYCFRERDTKPGPALELEMNLREV